MQAVDTNVLIRLLTGDDAAQSARAAELFAREDTWIAKTVLLEAAWVLGRLYAFDQSKVVSALRSIAGLPAVTLEDAAAMAQAFDLADAGLDLADAIHLASMGRAESFRTFDKKFASKAKKLAPVRAI